VSVPERPTRRPIVEGLTRRPASNAVAHQVAVALLDHIAQMDAD
jgi:hypothetical protein